MKRHWLGLLSAALLLASAAADAQTAVRVRGTITAIDGSWLSVKSREGKDLKMALAQDATFSYKDGVRPPQ